MLLEPDYTTVSEVHEDITELAVELANRDPDKHPRFIFEPKSIASRKTRRGIDGLSMVWDHENGLRRFSAKEQQEITDKMERVAQRAFQKALQEQAGTLIGTVIGEARQGRNYFDVFTNG